MDKEISIKINRLPPSVNLNALYIFNGNSVCTNMTFENISAGESVSPTAYINNNEAQMLIDELWNI